MVKEMGNVESSKCHDEEKQKIGEKLFEIIKELNPDQAAKITGMLMEMDSSKLEKLLSDRQELKKKVEDAAKFLEGTSSRCTQGDSNKETTVGEDFQSIGDILYGIIEEMYPASADKITGMLLEMGTESVKQLLKDKSLLAATIDQAAVALVPVGQVSDVSQSESTKDVKDPQIKNNNIENVPLALELSSMPELDQKQFLGEQLYLIIEKWHPDKVDKVTGMLLDMDTSCLVHLLQQQDLLRRKSQEAVDALENTNSVEIRSKTAAPDVTSDEEEKISLGEHLYEIIEELYPDNAAKITGMLLEMNIEDVRDMLRNRKLLQEKARIAHQVLMQL